MAAKLLHSLVDDNPDLQKQIGCMTGIFQIFDRQQVLTGRRLTHKRLPPGNIMVMYRLVIRINSFYQYLLVSNRNMNALD